MRINLNKLNYCIDNHTKRLNSRWSWSKFSKIELTPKLEVMNGRHRLGVLKLRGYEFIEADLFKIVK